MFPYQDPTTTDLLNTHGALELYRCFIDREYQRCGNHLNSSFATLDMFSAVSNLEINKTSVSWCAFPRSQANLNDQEIDNHRSVSQDEFVEWRVERAGVKPIRITFTTLFAEFYQALAATGVEAILAVIRSLSGHNNPSVAEVFGTDSAQLLNTPLARHQAYTQHIKLNPWNNGDKGILHLTQANNTMSALFTMLKDCTIPDHAISTSLICETSSCLSERNSDSRICVTTQSIARDHRALTLTDPVGIEIDRLEGQWELNGKPIDNINARTELWQVFQGKHSAVLNIPDGLTINGDEIITGAQVARHLFVKIRFLETQGHHLPIWGQRRDEVKRNNV